MYKLLLQNDLDRVGYGRILMDDVLKTKQNK